MNRYSGVSKHEACESDDMKTCEHRSVALVILNKSSASCCPCERPFYDPSARQQDKAALGFGQPDDFKHDTVGAGCLGRPLACVSLIDIGQFDAFLRHLLNGCGEASNLDAIVPIGWCDVQGQQMAKCVHGHMQF
ncbi:hypothetical protein KOEU_32550 [Komagataeibacter europaeus]|uniref:Uncharacterized protein n=1 Tax=Komagataeibacter europaeus TaxID=33995 RepID=A0A0M0EDC8_KOMEU|nr:hypothetical protein KOEU_32550 [Komagataeibacter europaeus]